MNNWTQFQTLVERNVQEIAQIEYQSHIPRWLEVAAAHCGQLFNATHIGWQLSMDACTEEKYLEVLEKLVLVQPLPCVPM